jgi:hypothetical protein
VFLYGPQAVPVSAFVQQFFKPVLSAPPCIADFDLARCFMWLVPCLIGTIHAVGSVKMVVSIQDIFFDISRIIAKFLLI